MGEAFDPYKEWLGIGPSERPVHHYRLLGIRLFEDDTEVIAAAADRRMQQIRRYQTGPRGEQTQRILNELADAKVCLLDPAARTAYNEMLHGLAAASDTARERHTLPEVRVETARKRPVPPRPYYRTRWFPAVAVVAMLLTAITVWAVGRLLLRADLPAPPVRPATEADAPPPPGVVVRPSPAHSVPASEPDLSSEPIVVKQEASGNINLTPGLAVTVGETMRLSTDGLDEVLSGWHRPTDTAYWRFLVSKRAPEGQFQVVVTYSAVTTTGFSLQVGDSIRSVLVPASADFVEHSAWISIETPGEHQLTLSAVDAPGFRVKWIRLSFP